MPLVITNEQFEEALAVLEAALERAFTLARASNKQSDVKKVTYA